MRHRTAARETIYHVRSRETSQVSSDVFILSLSRNRGKFLFGNCKCAHFRSKVNGVH